jgi:protein arginine kinase
MSGFDVGDSGDVVVATRVRLARNVTGFPFPHRASDAQRSEIASLVRRSLRQSGARVWSAHRVRDLSESELAKLVHDRWIALPKDGPARELWVLVEESARGTTVLVNEEDHVRIQAIMPGWDLVSPWESVHEVDACLRSDLRYAYSASRWGYLTASTGNVGTGLRVSAMVHLAGLGMTRERVAVLSAARSLDLAIRGLHGEGSEPVGDLFQISNAVSFGRPESGLRDRVASAVEYLIGEELRARRELAADPRALRRSLANAQAMSALVELTWGQCWSILSTVRLAGACGLSQPFPDSVFADAIRVLGVDVGLDDSRRASRVRTLVGGWV